MVSELINRISAETRRFAQRVAPGSGWLSKPVDRGDKAGAYALDYGRMRELMYVGDVYLPRVRGGMLEAVYLLLSRVPDGGRYSPIIPYFEPIRPVVDFYANALGGRLGTDIEIADTVKNDLPIHPRLKGLIEQVWRWSNLDARLSDYTSLGANQGTVGIRVCSDADTGRVYLDFDDRRIIRHVETDARGNVLTVYLRYQQWQYDAQGLPLYAAQVDEVISKYGNSLVVGGKEMLTPEQQENPLGVCPYVAVKHAPQAGSPFGSHAYAGTEITTHGINWAMNQLDESLAAHIWPTWFATSPAQGDAIKKIKMGKNNLVYAQTRAGEPNPTLDTLTPDLDTAGNVDFITRRIGYLVDRLPQLALSNMGLLSGISGETLAQVLKPAEAESYRARTVYESGLERAIQLAISVGIHNGLPGFDLSTGTGSVEAAERAFDGGDGPEAFDFKKRSALPLTSFQKVQQATADQAELQAKVTLATGLKSLGLPQNEVWRKLGYTDKEIIELKGELTEQSTLPPEEDDADA